MSGLYPPDLDAYFSRIDFNGERSPTLGTLHAITAHHAAAIPFENLNVLLELGIDIAPQAVERKLVSEQRGGYCFEQNQLLLWVLSALGFRVKPLSARVRWLLPREVTPPRTHLFVCVEMEDGPWLTDVGVGGCSLTAALRWKDGLEQETPHDKRRLVREGNLWFHQVCFDGDWFDVCEFTGEEMPEIDRQVANWWTSTHPLSKFRNNLLVSKAGLDGSRISLFNKELTLRRPQRPAEKRQIASHADLTETLELVFGLKVPEGTRFDILGLD